MELRFAGLYNEIVNSSDKSKMAVLGQVTKQQMQWFIDNRPDQAEEYIDMLASVMWDNFLTKKEAAEIVAKMKPEVRWSKEQVQRGLSSLGYDMEETPYYNSCAMWVTISMIYSDSGKTLAELIFGKNLGEVEDIKLLEVIYKLALDKLKDRDGVFNIRKYFGLL